MKKILFALIFVAAAAVTKVSAQEYEWGVGVRGGYDATGISVKHNFDPANGIEAIVAFDRGFNLFALYERHVPVIQRGFNFYYGAGGNLGSWKKKGDNKFTVGIDGIIGLEYKIQSIPLALSVDYKPCLNFVGHEDFHAADFGFTVKVTF